ncbi:hypothetical protein FHS95_002538 [Sphingomonas naasensis]|uniref:Haem-binding uptake Tiki superfamily ChaN domain-containing protein n=1 Tax=Sphingomonas naasensis TaxID=1344951 RepID=A0A4S1WMP9_9SPHN|nr:hypothetical protein [Sphingomonas naasensis]NIJ20846.1 hypothetical protein [Sphingomonas naasensis]TGX43247.1 hypothetical protein E5A74_08735 [Sphingomonas naasensis]
MIAALTALLGASASGCIPVRGADQLWQTTTRWVIVGEMHGTNEAPDAFANLVCLAAASGRAVTVALEYSSDDQAAIDAYLASDGGDRARAALTRLSLFTSPMQDGRGSVAFVRLFDRLRQLKMAGRISGVVASDLGRATPDGLDRDAAMARMWTAIPTSENGLVLALAGNIHAMRKPITFSGRTIVTAGSLLPARQTVTVNIEGNGGQEWNCRQDGCGPHEAGPSRAEASGITFSQDPDRRWDGSYQLGIPTTAASPALSAKPGGRSAESVR